MNNETVMIANAADQYVQDRLAAYYGGSKNLNPKHMSMYREFGWKENPCFADYFNAFNTIAAACGVVKSINNGTFQTKPTICEGDIEEAAEERTDWEKQIDSLMDKFWIDLKSADEFNLIGRYSGAILIVKDGIENMEESIGQLDSVDDILGIIPVQEDQLEPNSWYQDRTNFIQFGQPETFTYKDLTIESDNKGFAGAQPTDDVVIHESRIILFNEGARGRSFAGESILRSIYNNLLDIQKILGANAESFYKNAARHLMLSFGAETNIESIMQGYGINTANRKQAAEEFKQAVNDRIRRLNTGFDAAMMGNNQTVDVLSVDVSDPEQPILMQMNMIALAIGRSIKGLMGTQTGERASTEDAKQDAKANMERQKNFIERKILTRFMETLFNTGAIERKNYTWKWPNLLEMSSTEQVDLLGKMADAAQKLNTSYGEAVIEPNEVRGVTTFLPAKDELDSDIRPEAEEE